MIHFSPSITSPRKIIAIAVSLIVMSVVAACDINAQATPISIFPTAAPPGTRIPTFDAGGGTLPTIPPQGLPTIAPTSPFIPTQVLPTVPPVVPTPRPPTVIPTVDNNWYSLPNGVQWRNLAYRGSRGDVGVLVVRANPAQVNFRVLYTPGQVRTIQQWQVAIPNAISIINGNYFDTSNRPLGLVAVEGVLYGSAALRAARDDGIFMVRGGQPRVRSMFLEPFSPTERFEQAVHAFPILMAGGYVAPINPDLSTVWARRMVIAQDKYGRILFITTQYSQTSLPELATWLGVSGLELSYVVNMDGGDSTNMYLRTGGPYQFIAGLKPIPVVLAMLPK